MLDLVPFLFRLTWPAFLEFFHLGVGVRIVESEEDLRATCREVLRSTYERDFILCVLFHSVPNATHGGLDYTLFFFAGGLPPLRVRHPAEYATPEPSSVESELHSHVELVGTCQV